LELAHVVSRLRANDWNCLLKMEVEVKDLGS
jgi:hypothetical protein